MLRSALLVSSALALAMSVANSADLPSRVAPPTFVAAAPSLGWTGFYVGGQIGAISTRSKVNYDTEGANNDWTSVSAGIHIGYNHRINNIVAGVEADVNAKFGNGNFNVGSLSATPYGWQVRSTLDASLRARLGFLVTPSSLVYATGGLAASSFSLKNSGCPTCASWGDANLLGGSRFGWTVGVGIEHMLSANWSARIEYRHTDYGSKKTTYDYGKVASSRLTDDRVTVGMTYHFGASSAPIVAKY